MMYNERFEELIVTECDDILADTMDLEEARQLLHDMVEEEYSRP